MDKHINNQPLGVITLMVAITGIVAFFSLQSVHRQTLPPLTIKASQLAATAAATSAVANTDTLLVPDHALQRSDSRTPNTHTHAQANAKTLSSKIYPAKQTDNPDQFPTYSKLTSSAAQSAVNINRTTSAELQRLPGVGPAIAQRIVAYRQANGAFKRVEDLKNVSGIGKKKYAKLVGFITVN